MTTALPRLAFLGSLAPLILLVTGEGHRVAASGTFVDPCAVKFAYPRIVDYGQVRMERERLNLPFRTCTLT